MTLKDDETGDLPDEALEAVIAAAGKSRAFAWERKLAATSDCPSELELRELARGSIEDRGHRDALARHLVVCPNCLERNLSVLGHEVVLQRGDALPNRASSRHLSGRALAAAAVLIVMVFAVHRSGPSAVSSPFVTARGTDAYGFEDRNGNVLEDVVLRRTVVQPAADGFVALAVLDGSTAEIVAVEGSNRSLAVRAGEEVLLPLDRALPCHENDVWLVIHSTTPIEDAELSRSLAALVRGYEAPGFRAQRVAPRVR